MNPKVSVIVPVYNAEKYIEKCVNSIRNQSLKDIEIILINDGSIDRSKEIIEGYAKQDNRIVVINKENGGPAAARNKGIKLAKGKYIGFVDSDDYIEPDMYEKLFEVADKDKVQVAMCGYKHINTYKNTNEIISSNVEFNMIHNKEYIREQIIRTFTKNTNYGYFSLWNKLYDRQWLLSTGILMDETRDHGEDWWFNINIFMNISSFIAIGEPLYNYIHVNSNSLMVKYREEQFDLFLDGRMKVLSTIPKELIDYTSLDKNFVYEFSSYILRTNKEVKDSIKRRELLKKVVNNNEVIGCSKNVVGLPIHFRIAVFLIRNKMKNSALSLYKLMSLVI
ncbi:glycosyltransferase family 2 protein [Clostridium culturomicium]|uniref:glycosyltransferase family 2 protein n=1 Tax=Clostridium culturomicium TaxID=1499683 RepID=UPI003857806D